MSRLMRDGGGGGRGGEGKERLRRRERRTRTPDSAVTQEEEEEEGEETSRPSSRWRGQRSRSLSAGAERRRGRGRGRSLPRNTRKNQSDDEVTMRSQREQGRDGAKERKREKRRSGGLRKSASLERVRWLESQSDEEEEHHREEKVEEDEEEGGFMPIPNRRLPRPRQGRVQQVEEWESEEEEDEEEEGREEEWMRQQGRSIEGEEEEEEEEEEYAELEWGRESARETGWEQERAGEERVRAWASQVQRQRAYELDMEPAEEREPQSADLEESGDAEEEEEEEEKRRPRMMLPPLSGLPVLPVGAKPQLYVAVLPPLSHQELATVTSPPPPPPLTRPRLHPFSFLRSTGSEYAKSESGASVSVTSTTAASITGLSLVLPNNPGNRKSKTALPGPWLQPSPHTLHRVIQGKSLAKMQEGRGGGEGGGVPRFIQ